MKILLIDDNKDITSMLSQFLDMKGFPTKFTNDSKEGLHLIKNGNYDVILLDLSMPEFSGFDIIENLGTEGVLKNQNIFIFSAENLPQVEVKNLLSHDGINGVLHKPLQLSKIVAAISGQAA